MKDLAELPIQNFCSYENFDKLGSINGFKNFALFILEIKIQNFHYYTWVVCFHVSLGSGVGSPGRHGSSGEKLDLKIRNISGCIYKEIHF